MSTIETQAEESLDPQDWQALRQLGHQMVDDMLGLLENIEKEPVWQPMPDEVLEYFQQPLPQDAEGEQQAYQDFLEYVLPYRMGNIHPLFLGWVMGNGLPYAMLAEMLASGMNSNLGGGNNAPVYVETQVINWLKELLGFPEEASGIFTSGGSMANLIGLTVARNRHAGFDVRLEGMCEAAGKLVVYASNQVHSSVHKAVELLGLGRNALREIRVDDQFSMDPMALREAITADRAAGLHPLCVVGTAGTTNTGAFDPLETLADICAAENLWFHVDGAFGAMTALSPQDWHLVKGMERADTLAFDLHKWMYMPFEAACTLVRSEYDHRYAFSLTPEYLTHTQRGPAAGAVWPSDYDIQLTRGFRALKVWMALKAYGSEKFGRLIHQNIAQAHYLAEQVDAQPKLERLAPVTLNIVCFRYRAHGLSAKELDHFNQELLLRLQEQGTALPTYTTINGNYVLRACITNYRTRRRDLDLMLESILDLGLALEKEWPQVATELRQ
jgi:aromatic-L-amino-acid decarboxylase